MNKGSKAGTTHLHEQGPVFECNFRRPSKAFPHFWEHTVGSGHAPLALRADWQAQMLRCHNKLGFKHVRFHALLSDEMGLRRVFYEYKARGAPLSPDDGTISPWAVAASLPFAPETVIGTLRHAIERLDLKRHSAYGFDASFNPTYPDKRRNRNGWISPWIFGLNQGPIVLMIENHESELIWKTVRKSAPIARGLHRAGFRGGWLDDAALETTVRC